MKILVTGGAGYIGSFMARALLDRGDQVVVFDSLERGHAEVIDSRSEFIKGDLKNKTDVEAVFQNRGIEAVMHFGAYALVEESTREPDLYYQNNVVGSDNLFRAAVKNGIHSLIFSSTAAVYGIPSQVPIPEDHPKNPTNPYGQTKLKVEENLEQLRTENPDTNFAVLRYFNAAGAAPTGRFGENHKPETHIIPLAIRAALSGSEFSLFGTDYDTPDGTCIRDYIHVLDLVDAHILALQKLNQTLGGFYYNVGTGKGYSNREVVSAIEKVSGKKIDVVEKGRRAGDPDRLVADPSRINRELSFNPHNSDLETIVKNAWVWHKNQFDQIQ